MMRDKKKTKIAYKAKINSCKHQIKMAVNQDWATQSLRQMVIEEM